MGWYLYGVTSTDGPAEPPGDLRGIDDAGVRFHAGSDLRLVVSPMDTSLAELEQADPETTIAAVRRHDAVLTALALHAPVVPVRFGTVLADETAAEQVLTDPDGGLTAALAAVAGADEWVVQVDTADRPATAVPEEVDALTPGHAFFARKQSQARARADARTHAATVAGELGPRLRRLARKARDLPPREPETVARVAYLVDRETADVFLAAVGEPDGAAVSVQGPLPPYRFVETEGP